MTQDKTMADQPIDPRAEPPAQPATKQVPREDILQAQLSQLLTRMGEGFAKVDVLVVDVTRLTGTVELVSNDLGIVKDRVTILEAERTKQSGGLRGLSNAGENLQLQVASLQAQLAEAKARTVSKEDVKTLVKEAAASQTAEIATIVETFAKTPTAQKLKGAILPVLMAAIAIIGIKLTVILNKLQEAPPPPPTVVQLAPITVYGDAGTK